MNWTRGVLVVRREGIPMIGRVFSLFAVIAVGLCYTAAVAQEEGAQGTVPELPDGISHVKTNPDGTLKSFIVKATVPVETGGRQAERTARGDARVACSSLAAEWLKKSGVFYQRGEDEVAYLVKESGKGAPEGLSQVENKGTALANASGSKMVTLVSEFQGDDQNQTYVLVMGLMADLIPTVRQLEADDEKEPFRGVRLRPSGPPRSLEDDAARRPAVSRAAAEDQDGDNEAEQPEKKNPTLSDFL